MSVTPAVAGSAGRRLGGRDPVQLRRDRRRRPGGEGEPDGTSEVGCWTAAHTRGRGIAVSAVNTVSQWAFDVRAIARLDLLHAAGNDSSCRVVVRCGYVLDGLFPSAAPAFPAEGHRHVRTAAGQPRGRFQK